MSGAGHLPAVRRHASRSRCTRALSIRPVRPSCSRQRITLKARDCAYEHAEIVLETLNRLGYEAAIYMPDDAFEELERVEG